MKGKSSPINYFRLEFVLQVRNLKGQDNGQ